MGDDKLATMPEDVAARKFEAGKVRVVIHGGAQLTLRKGHWGRNPKPYLW